MPQILPLSAETQLTVSTTPPSQKMQVQTPQTAEPTKEPQVSQEPQKKDKDETVDPRFAALSRKERQILRQSQDIKKREAELNSKYAKYAEVEQLSQTNKLEALKRLGLTYDDLTNAMLNQQNLTPEQVLEQKAREIAKEETEKIRQEQRVASEKATAQSYQQALKQITLEAEDLVTKSESFPIVKHLKAFDTITALIEQEFHDTGRILPVEEAANQVEQYLYDQSVEIAKLEKIRTKILPQEEKQPASVEIQGSQVQSAPKTLTHKTTVAPPASKPLTAQEKRVRAERVFYGEIP